MKLIKPSVQFFGAVPTDYESALKFIEMAGRTCYKSEDKITLDSAEKFVKKLINAGHLAMVEHSNFVIKTNRIYHNVLDLGKYLNFTNDSKYTYIGGNLTAWFQMTSREIFPEKSDLFLSLYGKLFFPEIFSNFSCDNNKWQICPFDEIPPSLQRYSAKFICDRGVSHELVRHRPCSFAQESTRYVNYADKDIEFIEPNDFNEWSVDEQNYFENACNDAETHYCALISTRILPSPQRARAVLPNALKTEIIVTADAEEWSHIRKLRTAAGAHPDMQRVMNMMPWEEFL